MKTKIVLRNENLWQRIQGFSPDADNAAFPFSKKLAKEENWSSEFTTKAIEEYKKFVYLCCISPTGASPSEIIDKVWHMHLIYTQNYWEVFCPEILRQSLHHHPSNGGKDETARHRNWFSETLKMYREIFNEEPPAEIWSHKQSDKTKKSWLDRLKLISSTAVFLLLISCSENSGVVLFKVVGGCIGIFFFINILGVIFGSSHSKNRERNDGSSGFDSGSSSSCSSGGSSCGSSCGGGGCGGCGS